MNPGVQLSALIFKLNTQKILTIKMNSLETSRRNLISVCRLILASSHLTEEKTVDALRKVLN